MYDTYVFDLDGTLLNTLDDLASSVNFALKEFDFPLRTREEVRSFVGNGIELLIKRALPNNAENAFSSVFSIFKTHYAAHSADSTYPYDGVLPMLERLKTAKKHVAVVSNKADFAVKDLCERYFSGLIDLAVGENEAEGVKKKPAPDSVYKAIALLGGTNAVYVGDSDVDIQTALNAHLPCLSVTWGFRDRAFLERCGATTLVDDPKDIF